MRYYLDTEFDGHNGPLLSLALVREDGESIYVVTNVEPRDAWVIENVDLNTFQLPPHVCQVVGNPEVVGYHIRRALKGDPSPVIIADSAVDIGRFCTALTTNHDGSWASFDGDIRFEVHDVACYPTTLPGAIQHNAWWDAMALRHKLTVTA